MSGAWPQTRRAPQTQLRPARYKSRPQQAPSSGISPVGSYGTSYVLGGRAEGMRAISGIRRRIGG
jgi:hypothetical protein